MNVLVTGAAGFIGSNLCMRLLEEQLDTLVVGLDNLNTYYDCLLYTSDAADE